MGILRSLRMGCQKLFVLISSSEFSSADTTIRKNKQVLLTPISGRTSLQRSPTQAIWKKDILGHPGHEGLVSRTALSMEPIVIQPLACEKCLGARHTSPHLLPPRMAPRSPASHASRHMWQSSLLHTFPGPRSNQSQVIHIRCTHHCGRRQQH